MPGFALSKADAQVGPDSVAAVATQHADARRRLRALIDANWTTQAIAATVRLRLPDLLLDGAQTVESLASQASCHQPSLHRLLRALTSISILLEREDGRFELTETGRLLGTETPGSMAAWAELCGTSSWVAWAQLDQCVRTGTSARKLGSGAGGFDHLAKDAAAATLFNRAMVGVSRPVAASFATEVDFAGVQRIVDVGGGFGELLAAVLATHPRMQGVLFDMAHAIAGSPPLLAAAGVADRCELVAGDFFKAVPSNADAYSLKTVLHDWDDEQCTAILRKCAEAMPPHARLLIVERLMPDHFKDSAHDRGVARGDLNMLVAQEGKERTLEQYQTLLVSAGLRLKDSQTLSTGFSVLTAARA